MSIKRNCRVFGQFVENKGDACASYGQAFPMKSSLMWSAGWAAFAYFTGGMPLYSFCFVAAIPTMIYGVGSSLSLIGRGIKKLGAPSFR